jgi:hypothetical protein
VLISEPYSVAEAKTHKVALRGRSAFGHDFPTIEYKALSEEHWHSQWHASGSLRASSSNNCQPV